MSEMVERAAKAIEPTLEKYIDEDAHAPDIVRDVLEAIREPTPRMMRLAEGYSHFVLPDAVGPNTPEGRVAEMTNAWKMAVRVALGEFD